MNKNNSKSLYTLNQLGLQSLYQDAITKYFNSKFQNPSAWYGLLKEISQRHEMSLVQAWYDMLYRVFL